MKRNLAAIANKPIILFTVSGAEAGPKLDGWIADSLPGDMVLRMQHVALGGRLDLRKMSWWVRLILRIGAWTSDDPKARKLELGGFDLMDKSSVKPIQVMVERLQASEATTSR